MPGLFNIRFYMINRKEQPSFSLAMPPVTDDEIDLRELFTALWRGKLWLFMTTLLGAVISIAIAISLPNVYRAEALLAPSSEQQGGGLAAMAAQFGGPPMIATTT